MKKPLLLLGRVITLFSFLFVASLTFVCITSAINHNIPEQYSLFSSILIPSIHIIMSIILLILFFKDNLIIKFIVFQIESCVAIYTGFETLGTFLFYISIFLLFIFNFTDKKQFIKFSFLLIIHIFFLIIDPFANPYIIFINILSSFYMMFMFIYCYELLQNKFSSFIPKAIIVNSNISDKKPGDIIKLSDYKLSERQINLVYDYLIKSLSYKELSEKYYVSLSTVKREFTDVYKIFGVNRLEELHILLLQYTIEK